MDLIIGLFCRISQAENTIHRPYSEGDSERDRATDRHRRRDTVREQ